MLEDYRDFRNELEHHKKQLQEEKEALVRVVAEKDQQITQLDEAKKQLSEAKASLETHLVEKDHELVALDEVASSLQDARNEVQEELAQTRTDLGELQKAQSKLTGEKAALELELKGKSDKLATLGKEKAGLDTSLAEATQALDQVTQEKVSLAEEVSALEKLITERNTEMEALRNERLTLAKEKELLDNNLSEKEKELAVLKEAQSKIEADLSTANTQIAELTRNINDKAAKTEALEKELSALKVTAEQREAEYAVSKEELAKMAEQVEDLETQSTALESELKAMTARMEQKAGLAESKKAELSDVTKKLEEAIARINTREAELKEATGKAEERQTRIDSLTAELNDLKTTAQTRTEDLESKLGILTSTNTQLQQDLATKTTRLTELDTLRVPLHTDPEDTYVILLDSVWTRIASLIETTFRQDLSPSTLSDESCWTNLLQSPHTRHIPLPRTNTPAAKQMRIAVILSLLSRSLHAHIFRPVYLTSGEESLLPQILHTIGVSNPSHEEHTRATLLAMLPGEKQRAFGSKRVAAVVREVSYAVQHLLNALQYEAFCNGLEQVVKLACGQWMRIQTGKMRVEPYFGPPFGEFDWQVLPLPVFEERDDLVVEVGRPVEDGQEAVTDSRVVEDEEVGPDDIMLVVWPSMCVVENGELESITQGLVISKDQVRAATDEVRGRGKQRPGAKRARTLSMPGRGVSGQAFSPQAGKADLVDG